MQLRELLSALETIAPTHLAEAWDNVGLLVGDPAQPVTRVMLTVDYTHEVAREAERERCDVVVAYHPPIFDALKKLTAPSVVYDAARRGVAIWSPHTALDVADGGTNDVLADALGLETRAPLRPAAPRDAQHKLVTFVPEDAVERVARALFDAGAGRIGNYSSCSFRSGGTGTFFGEAGANPAVGEAGRLESAAEVKLETVVPIPRVDAVVRALRAAHPYEEPAFDLVRLAAPPQGVGIGRVGEFRAPVERGALVARVKASLGLAHVLVAGPTAGELTRAATCAGAGGDLLKDAIASRAGLYLTGELRHHDALAAARAGMTVVCALHSNSERATLARLRDRLARELPALDVAISREDRDPFAFA
jgi:dinuclear metal center YbgI/SA1388 family protein